MAYKEVISFCCTVTVLFIKEERCGKNSPVISVQCKIVLDPPPTVIEVRPAAVQMNKHNTLRSHLRMNFPIGIHRMFLIHFWFLKALLLRECH